MRTPAERVRKYIRARREQLKWSQTDLAREAGGISRTTVKSLEDGSALREGKEAAIETALGWQIGSIDAIRQGGEPTMAERSRIPTIGEVPDMTAAELQRVIARVEELNGPAAAQQFRADVIAYLDRYHAGQREREPRS